MRPSSPSASSVAQQPGALGGHAPQQRGHVDLDEDETDLPLGSVQVERAPQDDDHALGQVDALLGQRVAQRRPRAAPALDVERGHTATGPGRLRRPVVAGFDQAHVEVAGAVVRDVLDLPAHPQVAVPGEGRAQRALDLLVEAADGEDPAALPGVPLGRRERARHRRKGPALGGGGHLRGGQRRCLGIEELVGTAGHPRHPTEALLGHLATGGVAHWW